MNFIPTYYIEHEQSHIFSIVIEVFKFLTGGYQKAYQDMDEIKIENSANVSSIFECSKSGSDGINPQNQSENSENVEIIKEEVTEEYVNSLEHHDVLHPAVLTSKTAKKRKIKYAPEQTRIFDVGDLTNVSGGENADMFHVSNATNAPQPKVQPSYTTLNSEGQIELDKERDNF
jgi:hypothetical protein